jgi:hypothetical protein
MVFACGSRLLRYGLATAVSLSLTGVTFAGLPTDMRTSDGTLLLADSGSTTPGHQKPTPKKGHGSSKSKKSHKCTKHAHKGKKGSLHSKAHPQKSSHQSLGGPQTRTS